MNTEIWTSISGFVDITKYPKLPCPYCKNGEVALDQGTFQTKPLPDKYKEMASRHYEDQQKLQEARITDKGELVVAAYDEHPLWGILVGACALGTELNEKIRTVGQCISFLECQQCQGVVSAVGFAKVHHRKAANEVQQPTKAKFEYFTPTIPMMDVSSNVPIISEANFSIHLSIFILILHLQHQSYDERSRNSVMIKVPKEATFSAK